MPYSRRRRENFWLDFSILAEAFDEMTKTSSRLQLTSILVEVLKKTPKNLVAKVSYLTQGKLYPDFVGIEIGMAEKTVSKSIERAYGAPSSRIQELFRKTGDLGDVAAELSSRKTQLSLTSEK